MANEYRVKAMPKGGFVIYDSSGNGVAGFSKLEEAFEYIKLNLTSGC